MPLLRLKARQSQCHSDKGLGKACLSWNRATLYVLWELSNVSVSTGTLLNQDKTDGKTKKKKRKGKIKKTTTTTTSTFTRKKRFGFRCLSTILFVELRRVCFRSASTSDGHLDHLAPGRERPYSPGKCQGRNESCISLVSAARSLHSPSVIIIRVSYEQLKCSLFVVSQYLIPGEILQWEPQIRDMNWSSLVLMSSHFHRFISEFPTKTRKFFLPKIGSASSHSFW